MRPPRLQPLPGGTHAFVVAARERAMRNMLFCTLAPDEGGERDGAATHHEEETEAALLDQVMISRPALVVMDVELASGDGLSACARLKSHPLTYHTAVVVVSSCYHGADFDRALAAGADAFLVKPFSTLRLRALAEELCFEAHQRARLGPPARHVAPGTHRPPAHVAHPERYDQPPAPRQATGTQPLRRADQPASRRRAG